MNDKVAGAAAVDAVLAEDDEFVRACREATAPLKAPGFGEAQGAIRAPEAKTVSEIEPVGDLAVSEKLATIYKDTYRWATHLGSWMRWTGTVWHPIPLEFLIEKASFALFDQAKRALDKAVRPDKDALARLQNDLKVACCKNRIMAGLALLSGRPGFFTESAEWDKDPWLLNTTGGILDLRNGKVSPSDPRQLFTKEFNSGLDPQATCPRWEAHVELCLPDPDVRRTVQRLLGLSLTGARLDEKLMFWVGTGQNGKSTSAQVLLKLFGDYGKQADVNLLTLERHQPHPTAMANLCGCRLAFVTEIERGAQLAEVRAKLLTGGDSITARYMAKDFFSFAATWQIVLVGNHRPRVRSQDLALWRRITLIPWNVTIPEHLRRPQNEIIDELLEERDGILRWLAAGLGDWLNDHNWTAQPVIDATAEYRAAEDLLAPFLGSCCEFNPHFASEFREVYAAYLDFCERVKARPVSRRSFSELLESRGIASRQEGHSHIAVLQGLRVDASRCSAPYARNKKSTADTESHLASVREGSESESDETMPEWVQQDIEA